MSAKAAGKPNAIKKDKGGRPAHKPTETIRQMVKALAIAGVTQERIAETVELNLSTVRKHYLKELTCGRVQALGRNTVLLMNEAAKGNVTAAIYLQKCLGGPEWREKQDVNLSGGFTVVAAKAEDWSQKPETPLIEVHGE